MSLTCGSESIQHVALGLVLPDSLDPSELIFGAESPSGVGCNVSEAAPTCANADPDGLGSNVDRLESIIVSPNSLSQGVGFPNTFYFSMVGQAGAGGQRFLCDEGADEAELTQLLFRIFAVTPTVLPDTDRLVFTQENVDAVNQEVDADTGGSTNLHPPGLGLATSDPIAEFRSTVGEGLTTDDYVWSVGQSNADVRLILKPTIGALIDGLDEWDLFLDSKYALVELNFGVIVPVGSTPMDTCFVGVDSIDAASTACSVLPSTLSSTVDDMDSFTQGPNPSGPADPPTLQVHLEGDLIDQYIDRVLNRDDRLVKLGTLFVDRSNGNPPSITLDGLGTSAFVLPSEITETPTSGWIQAGGFISDVDSDGVVDEGDNCVFAPNPGQEDSGAVDPEIDPDGIGDACQCGEADGGGQIGLADARRIQELLVGLVDDPEAALRCSVVGGQGCDILDVIVVELRTDDDFLRFGPDIDAVCTRAVSTATGDNL